MKNISDLPPGSIGLVHSEFSVISFAIRFLTKSWSNHALIYFGSGRHETIEAEAKGVCIDTLDSRLNKKNRVKLFYNENLTVEQLQLIKLYAYSRVGTKYDYSGIRKFFGRIAGSWFGLRLRTKDDANQDFCSELAVTAFSCAQIKTSAKEAAESSPGDLEAYFTGPEGIAQGWKLWDTWNA